MKLSLRRPTDHYGDRHTHLANPGVPSFPQAPPMRPIARHREPERKTEPKLDSVGGIIVTTKYVAGYAGLLYILVKVTNTLLRMVEHIVVRKF